jgi:hypothetical protein
VQLLSAQCDENLFVIRHDFNELNISYFECAQRNPRCDIPVSGAVPLRAALR